MIQQFTDYYFWAAAPSLNLTAEDKIFMWLFLAITVLGVLSIAALYLNLDRLRERAIRKFKDLTLSIGLAGLIWFAIRYENTPIFGNRYWAGLILLVGLVWLGFYLKFLLMDYNKIKAQEEREALKKKYLPK
jgi:hypothetical protein